MPRGQPSRVLLHRTKTLTPPFRFLLPIAPQPKHPAITHFSRPPILTPLIITLLIALQLYLYLAPPHLYLPGVHNPAPFGLTVGEARRAVASVGSRWLLPGSVVLLGAAVGREGVAGG